MQELRNAECGMRNEQTVSGATSTCIQDSAIRNPHSVLRPRDLALLLLASGDLLPRKRARDQQADRTGMEIKRRILEQVAALDPEPDELDALLLRLIDEWGPPTGPTRAVAGIVRDEWQTACTTPEWVSQLLTDAVNENSKSESRNSKSKDNEPRMSHG